MRVSRVFLCMFVGLSLRGQIASLFGQSVTTLIHDVSDDGRRLGHAGEA